MKVSAEDRAAEVSLMWWVVRDEQKFRGQIAVDEVVLRQLSALTYADARADARRMLRSVRFALRGQA